MEGSFNNTDNNTDNNKDNSKDNITDNNTDTITYSRLYDSNFDNDGNNDEHLVSFQNRISSSSLSSISSNSISTFNISINSSISHISKSKKKIKIKVNKKEKYFFCIKCKKFYIIEFETSYLKQIECDCKTTKNCTVDNFLKNYTIKDVEIVKNKSNCEKHNNKKFRIYCKDCKLDLCEDCEKETKQYNNYETIIKKHETHGVINLQEEIKEKIKELKSLLIKLKATLPKGLIDSRRILNLIIAFTKYHESFYSYNLYKSLDNALKFCLKFELPNLQEMIKISSIKQLEENVNSNNLIISINLSGQKLSDLSAFRKLEMKSLINLNLNNNEIEDITPLENCNFENLEIFDIEENKLNNNNVKILKKFKMPKVKWFNLYSNNFTTTEIISIAKNFPNVESYFVGNNKFDKKELEKNIIYEFPDKLIEFGLTGNLTQETSDFILKLKIEKIKIFYISRNYLTNLSFLEKIKFENLEEIWPSFNNIQDLKEIKYINSKEKIKKINLKANNISNIDDILDIVKDFPNLKVLILENNPLNLIDDNIKEKLMKKNIILKI